MKTNIMSKTTVLLVDESDISSNEIKPELEKLGFIVDQATSFVGLETLLASFPQYDVILIEEDLPYEHEGKRQPMGLELADKLAKQFPQAQMLIFSTGDREGERAAESELQFYQPIRRDQPVDVIVGKIQQVGRTVAERRIGAIRNQLFQINKIMAALATQRSEDEIFSTIVDGISCLGFDRVRLYLLSDDGETLKGAAQSGMENEREFLDCEWDSGFLKNILAGQEEPEPVIYRGDDALKILDYETKMERPGLREWVIFPVSVNGELVGKLAADNIRSERQITTEELKPLMGIATHAAIAISNLKARQREAWKTQLIEVIQSVASDISRLSDLQDVYQAVSKAVVDLFNTVDHSGLVIFEQDYSFGKVVSEYPSILKPSIGEVEIPIKGIPFEDKLLQGAPFITSDDIKNDDSMGEVGIILTDLGIKSVVIIPLRHNNRLLGSFSLDAIQRKHSFSQDEIELAQIFAANVSAALANNQRLSELTALHEISKAMSQITSLNRLLNEIVDRAVEFAGGDNGGVHLFDEVKNVYRTVADKKRMGHESLELGQNEGMVGHMLANNLSHCFTHDYVNEPYASTLFAAELSFGSLLKVEMKHGDKRVGYLYVEDEVGRFFTVQDAERLKGLASLAGSAIYQNQLLENQKQLSRLLEALHYVGDNIESADEIGQVINYSLIGLAAEFALDFDRAAYFLIDSKNQDRLWGKAGYGHLTKAEWEAHRQDLIERGIRDRRSYLKASKNNQIDHTPLNALVRDIKIDLTEPESEVLVELFDSQLTWFHEDHNNQFIGRMPRCIRDLFQIDSQKVIVTMVAGDEKIGLLIVDNPHSKSVNDFSRLKALRTFVMSTAAAIKRIRRAEHLKFLSDIGQQAVSLQSTKHPTKMVIDALHGISGADNIAFVRVNLDHRDKNRLHLWSPSKIYSVHEIEPPDRWMRYNGNSVEVLESGEPKLIRDFAVEDNAEFHYAKGVLKMRSAICMPAIANEKRIGVVWFYFSKLQNFNSQQTIDLWQLFVNQAAAIYQLNSDYDKLESEAYLSKGVQEMVVSKDLDGVYDHIVEQARIALGKEGKRVSIALIGFKPENKQIVRFAYDFQNGDDWLANVDQRRQAELIHKLIENKRIINFTLSPQTQTIPAYIEELDWTLLLPTENVKAVSLIPIDWHGVGLAVMAIGYLFPQPFTQSQSNSLGRLARFAAVALRNANELKDKDREVARFNVLAEINQLVMDGETFFNQITSKLYQFMSFQEEDILFCDLRLREGDYLKVVSVFPIQYESNLKPIDLNGAEDSLGITGYAFQHGEIVLARDVTEDRRFNETVPETRSELAVPIKVGEHVIGVLNVEFAVINGFDSKDVDLVEAFAARVAAVMVKDHKFRQQEAFHEASKIVANAVTADMHVQTTQILQQVVEVLKPLNGSKPHLATISLIDKNSGDEYIENIYPAEPFSRWIGRENSFRLKRDRGRPGIAGQVQQDGESRIVGDVHQHPVYIEINQSTCSEMAVPLIDKEGTIGSLSVESEQPNAFMPEDLDALETFAQLVTIMLSNGRQYSELMDTRTQVESVTALSLMTMIAGIWQHGNKSRAVTIRERASLLQYDLDRNNMDEVDTHIAVIQEAAERIMSQKMRRNLADPTATLPESISECVREFVVTKLSNFGDQFVLIQQLADDKKHLVRLQKEYFVELLDIIFNNARQALKGIADPQIHFVSSIDDNKNEYTLVVWDNGAGFPEEILGDLLHKPIQKQSHEVGSGIGLLMVRMIVESFGGKIRIKNKDNSGAYIEMKFPVDIAGAG